MTMTAAATDLNEAHLAMQTITIDHENAKERAAGE